MPSFSVRPARTASTCSRQAQIKLIKQPRARAYSGPEPCRWTNAPSRRLDTNCQYNPSPIFEISSIPTRHLCQFYDLMHSGTIMRRPFYTRLQITTIALLTLLFAATPCNANCFFPDGSDATDMVECPDSKSCCGKNQACLSNGLCFGADIGVIYRGSCSDKSWPIAECPRACYTGNIIFLSHP